MWFYIAIHDAGRSALIAGPYPTEDQAISQMAHVQALTFEADPWSWFYSFSLARTELDCKTRFGPTVAPPDAASSPAEAAG
ncbi:MAG TPA: hypothetical protein VHC22_21760 [Pirellulales bacterium]|nr:hypothetical protein [Pirellulales bacterium]